MAVLTDDARRGFQCQVPEISLELNGRSSECFVQKTNPCVLYFEHVAPDCRTESNQSFMIFLVIDLVFQHGCVDGRRKKRVSVPGA